jgi:hypothetical protein
LAAARPADAASRERVERQEYYLGDLVPECSIGLGISTDPAPSNTGGACFRLRDRDLSVLVKIEDDTGLPVGGSYEFRSHRGATGAHGNFCGSIDRRVPKHTSLMVIYVHGPMYGVPECLDEGGGTPGTTGTITARFKLARLFI